MTDQISDVVGTGDFAGFLPPTLAQPYFDEALRASVVQPLSRQITLGPNGVAIPVTTTKPTAAWVSEGGQKPVTRGGQALVTVEPKKLAAIAVVSAEVVRANPGGYVTNLRPQIGEAFAIAFDQAALYGTNSPFTSAENPNYVAATDKTVTLGSAAPGAGGLFTDLNAGLSLLVNDKKRLTGFAFDSIAEPIFNTAVDTTGRPLFIDSPTIETAATVTAGRLLGRPAFIGDGVAEDETVGFGGDWTKTVWGTVGGISYDVSTQATVTIDGELTSLWEHNLVAIRVEAEFGWLCYDVDAFVKYNEAAGGDNGDTE
ncbi:phage major capsid protein [Gryllotalpicola protaetiae]|uniref:Phage major capsid protein n=1 Tax=Gryllotalpicola protaetiae TaxID=2419771 RepID=A0A387BEN9_9MICO|nr:phage major capsid protein [Gryllotalpicola protaetiae]AYG02373.1 phage major capsid protein [Gryllotalpicola protaetiae]